MTTNTTNKLSVVLRDSARIMLEIVASQYVWLLILALSSAALVSIGTYILAGLGWSLIVTGAFAMFFAAIIFKGITNG